MKVIVSAQSKNRAFDVNFDQLVKLIKLTGVNRYSGGRFRTWDCICDSDDPENDEKLTIYYSDQCECTIIEAFIKPLFKVFHRREF